MIDKNGKEITNYDIQKEQWERCVNKMIMLKEGMNDTDTLIEFAKEQSVVFPEDSAMGWYLRETLKMLQAEPCEDTVSKASVFEIMGNLKSIPYDLDRPINKKDVSESMDEIRSLPPVKPTRKKGKWIMPKRDDGMSDPIVYQVRCSVCGFDIDPQTYAMELKKFGANKCCPKCKAEMEGEE